MSGRLNWRKCWDSAAALRWVLKKKTDCGLIGRTPGLVVQVFFDNGPQYV